MTNKVTDERLSQVSDGRAFLSADELIAIIPEIEGNTRVQQLLASTVIVKRLTHGGHSSRGTRIINSE
jgi:hypothetical protein